MHHWPRTPSSAFAFFYILNEHLLLIIWLGLFPEKRSLIWTFWCDCVLRFNIILKFSSWYHSFDLAFMFIFVFRISNNHSFQFQHQMSMLCIKTASLLMEIHIFIVLWGPISTCNEFCVTILGLWFHKLLIKLMMLIYASFLLFTYLCLHAWHNRQFVCLVLYQLNLFIMKRHTACHYDFQ